MTIVAYPVLTFVSHHPLRAEQSVAALAEGDAALNGLGLACPAFALRREHRVTSTVAPVSARIAIQSVVTPDSVVARNTAFSPNASRIKRREHANNDAHQGRSEASTASVP